MRLLPLILLLACAGKTPDDNGLTDDTDPGSVDADGDGYSDDDCDDADANTNPGADDIPYDGEDQDCSGADLNDVDGDGYVGEFGGGDDCNDSNPTVNPGATEICYDGLDNDCDGVGGSDDTGAASDCDGDGTERVDDCDDENADIYPGAADAWYDGVDSDCAFNSDYDQDYDSEDATVGGGTDCDDLDPAVNAAADEVWDNIDNDCEGTVDQLNGRASTNGWYGLYDNDDGWVGHDFDTVGDLDGDGVDDVLIGAPLTGQSGDLGGTAYLMSSAGAAASPGSGLASIVGGSSEYIGLAVTALPSGNVVVTGLSNAYVLDPDTLPGATDTSAALASLSNTTGTFGFAGAWGDGLVTVGDPYTGTTNSVIYWSAAMLQGPGNTTSVSAPFVLTETGSGKGAGFPGDMDGDGLDEVLFASTGFSTSLKIGIVQGADIAAGGSFTADDVPGLTGATSSDESTTASMMGGGGDVDGDGVAEAFIGAMEADGATTDSGIIYVVGQTAFGGGVLSDFSSASVLGQVESGQMVPARDTGDVDQNGITDMVLTFAGVGSGEVMAEIWFVPFTTLAAGGSITPAAGTPNFVGLSPDQQFGFTTRLRDVDLDGDLDLFASALDGYGSVSWFLHGP